MFASFCSFVYKSFKVRVVLENAALPNGPKKSAIFFGKINTPEKCLTHKLICQFTPPFCSISLGDQDVRCSRTEEIHGIFRLLWRTNKISTSTTERSSNSRIERHFQTVWRIPGLNYQLHTCYHYQTSIS